jgi:hypothetical protein
MKPAILGFLFCVALAAQPASVEGTAVNQTNGQPIAGVHVRLVTGDFGGPGNDQMVYGAISDRTGHFSITDMKPGLYMVMPERTGFVQAPSAKPATPVRFVPLKPGQHLTGVRVEMTPRATISGRVLDEYGDPVQYVSVQFEPVPGSPQTDSFNIGQGMSATDDRGEFHLVTAPGRYYLKASGFIRQDGSSEVRTDGTSAAPFVATYYPGATSTSGASIVQAAPGQDIAGLEIRLARASAATGAAASLTISGVVTGLPDNAMVEVMLRHGDSPDQMNEAGSTTVYRIGKFSFGQLQPGFYRLVARYSSGKTHLRSQPVDLTLGNADETNVQLVLAPAEELTGTLAIAGDSTPAAPAEKRSVRLEPVDSEFQDGDNETASGDVDRNGAFRIADVAPGSFRPVVEPLPENAYIESVLLDDTPVTDNILDLSHGVKGAHIQITVSRNGAQVSGTVLDKDGQPLLNPMVMIYLMRDPKQMHEMRMDDQHRAIEGKYTIKAIRPGKYRLFALDALSLFSAAGDVDTDNDELMKSFFNSAEELEIKPGDRVVKDLKAIDKPPGKEPRVAQ